MSLDVPIKILITGKIHDVGLNLLKNPPTELKCPKSIEIINIPDASREEILKRIPDVNVLISRSETDVDETLLRLGKNLSLVARAAVGYGNIDCDLATELGILVVNTPGKNTNSAAELTMGLLLSVVRKIHLAHISTSQGKWNRHFFSGIELVNKTIGIIGIGNVGHRVAKFARGFDMNVIGFDPYVSHEVFRKYNVQKKDTLEELLKESDVVTLHVPLNKDTKNMLSEAQLKKMKRGAVIINAARGGIVCENALLKALNEGQLLGAGIDTFENEPLPMAELISHPNVLVTPHIGASTEEAQVRIGEAVATQVLKSLRGEIVDYPVNLPHVSTFNCAHARSLSVLVEKISVVIAQLFDFQVQSFQLKIKSHLKPEDLEILKLSAMKGFLTRMSDEFVSYVNASRLFAKRGIQFEIAHEDSFDTKTSILVELRGTRENEVVSVGGVLYDMDTLRLSSINEFLFEIEVEGELIVMQNHDRPGFIGAVGTYLAQHNVNIAQFELSRNKRGGLAMSLIRIDGDSTRDLVLGLQQLPNLISVRVISGL